MTSGTYQIHKEDLNLFKGVSKMKNKGKWSYRIITNTDNSSWCSTLEEAREKAGKTDSIYVYNKLSGRFFLYYKPQKESQKNEN